MFEAIVEAVSRAISTGNTFGIVGGIAAFIIVILYSISKAGEDERIKKLPKEVQLRIEMRKDSIEFWSMVIGVPVAIAISIWMIIVAFSD